MCVSLLMSQEAALGPRVRSLRISLRLTQPELAGLAKVTTEEVNLLEHDKPLLLDAKRRILKELYDIRAHYWDRLSKC